MSAATALPPPTRAGTDDLFRSGGDAYSMLPDPLFDRLADCLLGKAKKVRKLVLNAAPHVLRYFVKMAQAGKLDQLVTDRAIAAATGLSERTVQYVLWALDVAMGGAGMPIINRMRTQGRRIISFVRGFVPSGKKPATFDPPGPPLNTEETTTTRERSSSLRSAPENTGEEREVASPELIDRARRLIPDATRGKVIDVVAMYGAKLVGRALDAAEKHNRKPGNLKVKGWGFILITLEKMKREGVLDPQDPPPAPPAPSRSKVKPVKVEPVCHLTAEEVAELVRKSCSAYPADLPTLSRVQLRQALAEGAVPAELVATIPAELREPTKPRAP